MKGCFRAVVFVAALAGSVLRVQAIEPVCDMPIVAWGWPFSVDEALSGRYRLIRGCGCTHVIQLATKVGDVQKCLDAAEREGVRLILHSPLLADEPEKTIPLVRNHPALGAYYLADEPSVAKMPELGKRARCWRGLDPRHPVYMNWFGLVDEPKRWYGVETYDAYLETSLREVPTGLYSFDVYPLYAPRLEKRPLVRSKDGLFLRKDWFASLEAVSACSRRTKVPFWAFAAVVPLRYHRQHDNPMPTVAHLRFQQYVNLAYGAQGLQYYDFRPNAQVRENFWADGAPLSPEGKVNPSYGRLAEANRELIARAWVFRGADAVRVRHTGTVPQGAVAFDARKDLPAFVTEFAPDGDLLVSVHEKTGHAAFVVVNSDPNGVSAFSAKFAPGVQRVGRDGKTADACDGDYPMDVGDAEIFVMNKNKMKGEGE